MMYLHYFGADDLVNATNGYVNANTGVVTSFSGKDSLTAGMKTFYRTALLENAREQNIFNQFGMEQGLPANNGKTVEFRKWNTLAKAMTPLEEGVTPTGKKLGQTSLTVTVNQYGDYVELTDRLETEYVDDVVLGATEELGAAGGETYDTLTRNIIEAGTYVRYAPNNTTPVTSREDIVAACKITPTMINQGVTFLKKQKAPKINGEYICFIHPSVAEDLRESAAWLDVHKYAQPDEIYNGEIGRLHGCRFIEANVRVFAPAVLFGGESRFTVNTAISSSTTSVVIEGEYDTATFSTALPCYIGGVANTISAVTKGTGTSTLTVGTAITSLSKGATVCGKGGGKDGSAVYGNLMMGQDAFARIMPEAGNMEMIIKQLGSAGTGDPLDQRATVGYKFKHAAVILYPERILRLETGSSYSPVDEAN